MYWKPPSSADFALPGPSHSSAASNPPVTFPISGPSPPTSAVSLPTNPGEEPSPFILRFRRPSLLAPARIGSETRHSPLTSSSFTFSLSRRYSTTIRDLETETENTEQSQSESESDKDKMWTDSPPDADSGPATPALTDPSTSTLSVDSDSSMKTGTSRPRSPSTPPSSNRRASKGSMDGAGDPPPLAKLRRLSHPIKMPRILTLLAESRPEENEVKSEAQFQRLVASVSDIGLPGQPRTPRAASDRGRYPEEVDTEEPHREDTPSDEEDDEYEKHAAASDTGAPFAFAASEPINIVKPITPAQSVNGDDFAESPGGAAMMDIDMPSSSYGSPNMNSWRYTPPPTSSAVRSNKRKFDDRYDPYPTANKRRAVSPSLTYLRESQPSLFNPRTPNHGASRVPLPLPISIPNGLNSGASSPIVSSSASGSGLSNGRPLSLGSASAMSSPTLRAQIGLSSPILRPMIRARREGEGKEVEGAGEAVGGLSLE
ncbi:unnamed protein product [Somion occarium]|uniref:Uncharacterized protein n=1 Tax=Somion occarium TaxID=3059160 RepID=A0ABP1CEY7_9APHY